MKRAALLSTVLIIIPNLTQAQCVATTNCSTLGYTETSCPNGGLKCPFGNTWSCKTDGCGTSYQYTCTGANQIKPASGACGGKYVSCSCASGYEWNNGVCAAALPKCQVGYLYYTDNTCSYNLDSSKTVKGIVAYAKPGGGGVGMYSMSYGSQNVSVYMFQRDIYPYLSSSEAEYSCISTKYGYLPSKAVAQSIVNNIKEIASSLRKASMIYNYAGGGYLTGTKFAEKENGVWVFSVAVTNDASASEQAGGPYGTFLNDDTGYENILHVNIWPCFSF